MLGKPLHRVQSVMSKHHNSVTGKVISPAPGRSGTASEKCRNEKVVSCFPTLYNHFQEQPNYFYSLLWITLMIKKTRGQSKVPSSRSIHSKSTIWRDFGGISSEFQLDAVLWDLCPYFPLIENHENSWEKIVGWGSRAQNMLYSLVLHAATIWRPSDNSKWTNRPETLHFQSKILFRITKTRKDLNYKALHNHCVK